MESATDAYKSVLSDVGCTQPTLDDHDIRILEETRSGTTSATGSKSGLAGLPDHENDVGGFEDYPTVSRDSSWDSDGDGLPDWWETYYGLNPDSAAGDLSDAHADADRDGFTNLDDFLQWMAKPHYFVAQGDTVAVDLARLFFGHSSSPSYATSNAVGGTVSIAAQTASFTPNRCGMASFVVTVTDSGSATLSKQVVIFADSVPAGSCTAS